MNSKRTRRRHARRVRSYKHKRNLKKGGTITINKIIHPTASTKLLILGELHEKSGSTSAIPLIKTYIKEHPDAVIFLEKDYCDGGGTIYNFCRNLTYRKSEIGDVMRDADLSSRIIPIDVRRISDIIHSPIIGYLFNITVAIAMGVGEPNISDQDKRDILTFFCGYDTDPKKRAKFVSLLKLLDIVRTLNENDVDTYMEHFREVLREFPQIQVHKLIDIYMKNEQSIYLNLLDIPMDVYFLARYSAQMLALSETQATQGLAQGANPKASAPARSRRFSFASDANASFAPEHAIVFTGASHAATYLKYFEDPILGV